MEDKVKPVPGEEPVKAAAAEAPVADPSQVPPTTDGSAPEPKAPESSAAASEPPKAEPAPDWKMAEIQKLRAKVAELRKTQAAEGTPPVAGEAPADFNARVEARAKELATEQTTKADWDRRMNEIVRTGREQFTATEFNARIKAVRDMVDSNDQGEVQQYTNFLAAAAETGEAPKLLHALGGDPGRLLEVLAEPPLKMAVTLSQMATELKGPERLSAAPAPIKPISSQGIHYENIKPDDTARGMKLPIAEWMAQREKQARDRGLQ